MDPLFWLDRWRRKQIGFHQPDVNTYLQRWWPRVNAPPDAAVFVPLCGKSLDMRWLEQHGHRVIGVEVAPEAVREFFVEQGVEPTVTQAAPFERWVAEDITLLCGDFFALTSENLRGVRAVFDRAALVALPRTMRPQYVEHMKRILPPRTSTLLVAPSYAQHQMDGPPFSVAEEEVRALYEEAFKVELLETADVLDENPRFRDRGLTQMFEQVYLLVARE